MHHQKLKKGWSVSGCRMVRIRSGPILNTYRKPHLVCTREDAKIIGSRPKPLTESAKVRFTHFSIKYEN